MVPPILSTGLYVITTAGDRLDILAQQYYSNKDLWLILSIANVGLPQNSLYIPTGTQFRIPMGLQDILMKYDFLNS